MTPNSVRAALLALLVLALAQCSPPPSGDADPPVEKSASEPPDVDIPPMACSPSADGKSINCSAPPPASRPNPQVAGDSAPPSRPVVVSKSVPPQEVIVLPRAETAAPSRNDTAPPPPQDAIDMEIDRQSTAGRVIFKTETAMEVGRVYPARLWVRHGESEPEDATRATEPEQIDRVVEFANEVTASAIGDDKITVTPRAGFDATQTVTHTVVGYWLWDIAPKAHGQAELTLRLNHKIKLGEDVITPAVRTFPTKIDITIGWPAWGMAKMTEATDFFKTMTGFVTALSGLVAAFIGWKVLWPKKKDA